MKWIIAALFLVCPIQAQVIEFPAPVVYGSPAFSLEISEDSKNFAQAIAETLSELSVTFHKQRKRYLEVFFDTPELLFQKAGGQVFFRAEEYFTPVRKKQRFFLSVILSADGTNNYIYEGRKYNSVQSIEEKHPLLRTVQRRVRKNFVTRLTQAGVVHPMRMRTVFQLARIVHLWELSLHGSNVGTIEVHEQEASVFGRTVKRRYVTFSLKPSPYTRSEASVSNVDFQSSLQLADKVRTRLKMAMALREFNFCSDYRYFFDSFNSNLLFFPIRFRYPWFPRFLEAAVIFAGGLFLFQILQAFGKKGFP